MVFKNWPSTYILLFLASPFKECHLLFLMDSRLDSNFKKYMHYIYIRIDLVKSFSKSSIYIIIVLLQTKGINGGFFSKLRLRKKYIYYTDD